MTQRENVLGCVYLQTLATDRLLLDNLSIFGREGGSDFAPARQIPLEISNSPHSIQQYYRDNCGLVTQPNETYTIDTDMGWGLVCEAGVLTRNTRWSLAWGMAPGDGVLAFAPSAMDYGASAPQFKISPTNPNRILAIQAAKMAGQKSAVPMAMLKACTT